MILQSFSRSNHRCTASSKEHLPLYLSPVQVKPNKCCYRRNGSACYEDLSHWIFYHTENRIQNSQVIFNHCLRHWIHLPLFCSVKPHHTIFVLLDGRMIPYVIGTEFRLPAICHFRSSSHRLYTAVYEITPPIATSPERVQSSSFDLREIGSVTFVSPSMSSNGDVASSILSSLSITLLFPAETF